MRSPGRSNKVLAGFLVTALSAVAVAEEHIALRDYCPPGFELTDSNVCELRTLYDGYDSLNDIGIGGAPVKRAAPSLWNVAFLAKFFWEARASTLEEQTR
jgi:hypothetical protein